MIANVVVIIVRRDKECFGVVGFLEANKSQLFINNIDNNQDLYFKIFFYFKICFAISIASLPSILAPVLGSNSIKRMKPKYVP